MGPGIGDIIMKKYIKSATDIFRMDRIPWAEYISEDVLDRLSGCCNRKSDLPILRDALWQYTVDCGADDDYTLRDAAELALEWVGDWNNQYVMTDLTVDEYNKFINGGKIR